MKQPRSAAPIFAAVLLLLPVLYVGSYLALVTHSNDLVINDEWCDAYPLLGDDNREAASYFFWPINQIDRKLRPADWKYMDPFS
ncbi:hypothetical protein ETAA8_19570 [Anatilimnocola aggregata]|uniref:Uncharacterized protein n=1 Tax=Anatilimnocola aggregata TaxID=2528021 RepID=A0A517Y9F9_9BACT|nr:hypothetical protein [Anatilimnocola aggregata]QDU26873.1 hypothetical protein ETAA8_19570 [Anatilimnocola aggregata]